LGELTTLPNDLTPGIVTSDDYDDWKSNFGTSGAGGGTGPEFVAAPEADGMMIALAALVTQAGWHTRGRSWCARSKNTSFSI
jgi:hypothetical protein